MTNETIIFQLPIAKRIGGFLCARAKCPKSRSNGGKNTNFVKNTY